MRIRIPSNIARCVMIAGSLTVANGFDLDERDGKVLEAALVKLRDDPKFYCTKKEPARTNIVLFSFADRLEQDEGLGDDLIKPDNEELIDAVSRNHAVSAGGTNRVSFKGVKLPPGILMGERNLGELTFDKSYPTGKGWVKAFMPGYSKDGKHALVCASVGPTYHGAIATVILEEVEGKWIVRRHRLLWMV